MDTKDTIENTLFQVLMPDSGPNQGLPVPPILQMIASYLKLIPVTEGTLHQLENGITTDCVAYTHADIPKPIILLLRLGSFADGANGANDVHQYDFDTKKLIAWPKAETLGDASFYSFYPHGICVDPIDNSILVSHSDIVYRVRPFSVELVAGSRETYGQWKDGVGALAGFTPSRCGIQCSNDGTYALRVDLDNGICRIRHINLRTTQVTTIGVGNSTVDQHGHSTIDVHGLAFVRGTNIILVAGRDLLAPSDTRCGDVRSTIYQWDTAKNQVTVLPVVLPDGHCRHLLSLSAFRFLLVTSNGAYVVDSISGNITWNVRWSTDLVHFRQRAAFTSVGSVDHLYLCASDKIRCFSGSILDL